MKTGVADPCYTGGEHIDRIARASVRFCHIDVDVYQSARDTAESVWGRIIPGGIVVYDDYGFHGREGVTRFVDEERSKPGLVVIHNVNGHAVVIKLPEQVAAKIDRLPPHLCGAFVHQWSGFRKWLDAQSRSV